MLLSYKLIAYMYLQDKSGDAIAVTVTARVILISQYSAVHVCLKQFIKHFDRFGNLIVILYASLQLYLQRENLPVYINDGD